VASDRQRLNRNPFRANRLTAERGVVAKSGMATDSRGNAPGTTLQTDILSDRLITGALMTLWSSEAHPEISVDRGFKSLRPHGDYHSILSLPVSID
jgi:hypothetical protein